MDLQRAWESILDQLQAEMPRASFETWVRDAVPLSLTDGVLTVAARNAYARDWLDSRIWVRARQLLGESVSDLRFVVADDVVADDAEGDEDAAVEADEEDGESDAGAAEIEVSAEYASLYEQAVRPERAVYLPGYFRRWLPLLGPDLAWFYVGFRQAAYWSSHGRRSGQYSGRFSGRQVAALCGVTERTFWNRSGREETWRKLAGLIHRDGQRYTVAMSLPLTGPDARALTRWLATHIEEYGGAEGVLEAACQTPVEELLAGGQEQTDFPAMPLLQLLQETFPDLPEKTLKAAAEKLRLHLMPQNDQIVISLFFLENVLPWLKAGPAWVYVLLRDRCFVDKAGGGRDTVLVHGGYREIADWLGISRARTVYDWLRDPIARIYLASSVEQKGTGWETNPLLARVLLNDVPAEITQAAVLQKRPVFDANFSLGLLRFDAIFSDSCRDFQSSLTRISVSFDANFSGALTRISEFFDAIFSALKPLNTESESLKPLKTDQPTAANAKTAAAEPPASVGRQGEAAEVSVSGWDFDGILRRLEVNPTSRRRLREENIPPEPFLAWLLQAMTMRGVDPVRVAVAWTLDPRKRDDADEDFRLLAASPPELRRLAREIAAASRVRYSQGLDASSPVYQAYLRRFGDDPARAAAILAILFGDQAQLSLPLPAPMEAA